MSDRAKTRVIIAANEAFLAHGYEALSMAELSVHCGLTRRGLYNHFSNKEELFRATLVFRNALMVSNGDNASAEALARGAAAVEVIAAWLDARFGETRRRIGNTPHGRELNDTAFRVATDIMIEVSYVSNRKLSDLVGELCDRDLLVLRDGYSRERIGRLIGDGARGVNQARPPIPNDELAGRYREIAAAILFGCAAPPPNASADRSPKTDAQRASSR